jgi:hypothetical protein
VPKGDAAEYNVGETHREILTTVRTHGSLTPKQASQVTVASEALSLPSLCHRTPERE